MHLIVWIAWLMWKSNAWKYMCIINGNAVGGHSSENYLTQRFYRLKDFCTRNVYSTTSCVFIYLQFFAVYSSECSPQAHPGHVWQSPWGNQVTPAPTRRAESAAAQPSPCHCHPSHLHNSRGTSRYYHLHSGGRGWGGHQGGFQFDYNDFWVTFGEFVADYTSAITGAV